MKEFTPSVTLKLCEWQLIDVVLAFFMVLPMWRTLGALAVTNTCHTTQVSMQTWLSPGLCHSATIYQIFPHSHHRTTVWIDLIYLTLLFLAFNSQNVLGKTCKNAKKVTMIRLTSKLPLSLAIEFFPLTQLKQGLFKVSLSITRS